MLHTRVLLHERAHVVADDGGGVKRLVVVHCYPDHVAAEAERVATDIEPALKRRIGHGIGSQAPISIRSASNQHPISMGTKEGRHHGACGVEWSRYGACGVGWS